MLATSPLSSVPLAAQSFIRRLQLLYPNGLIAALQKGPISSSDLALEAAPTSSLVTQEPPDSVLSPEAPFTSSVNPRPLPTVK